MSKFGFLKVLKDNIECAFCKEEKCPVKYLPGRRKMVDSYYIGCKKELDKRFKNALKRKMP